MSVCPLSPGELAAVQAIANGETRQQFAARTGRSVSTVRTHLASAYRRLGVANGTQAAVRCWREGWIQIDGADPDRPPVATPVVITSRRGSRIPRARKYDRPLTLAQRRYLAAFDAHLQAHTDEEKIATRQIMDRALAPMCADAGIDMNRKRRRDLIALLIADHRARQAA